MNFQFKTQRAAITKALLDGRVLSIRTGFDMFGCSNVPRELGRSVINPTTGFGTVIVKIKKDFTSEYGSRNGYYYEYRLDKSDPRNKLPLQKMREYLKENMVGVKHEAEVKLPYKEQELAFQ